MKVHCPSLKHNAHVFIYYKGYDDLTTQCESVDCQFVIILTCSYFNKKSNKYCSSNPFGKIKLVERTGGVTLLVINKQLHSIVKMF